jgi:hypothetical protein
VVPWLKWFRIFEKHRKIVKLNVIENWKFASRCRIASGLYGPLKNVKLFHVLQQCKYTATLTFHIFGSLNTMKTKIPRSIQCNNMSSFIAIVLVDVNFIAIYELWKSSEFVSYQITQLSEQKYRLAIPFAEAIFPFVNGRYHPELALSSRVL